MTIRYAITTGKISQDGAHLGTGYSGQPGCKNDPAKCDVRDAGPIPLGRYRIGDPVNTETHGPYVLPLEPDQANEMHGRAGFLIHGDSISKPGTASHGCIIAPRSVREAIHKSGDRDLEVTA